MIIHPIEIVESSGKHIKKARIEFNPENSVANKLPQYLTFTFAKEEQKFLTERHDGFLINMLLMGMHLGENIEVRGVISERLFFGIEDYQLAYQAWYPKLLSKIEISPSSLVIPKNSQVKGVGQAFSGGVDSSFTLAKHIPEFQKAQSMLVTHALQVEGFGNFKLAVDIKNKIKIDQIAFLNQFGIKFLNPRTNIRQFTDGILSWGLQNGVSLSGMIHNYGNLFNRFFIPSNYPFTFGRPAGTTQKTVHLLSTESTEIYYDGTGYDYYKKIDFLADWGKVNKTLRPCSNDYTDYGFINCGQCNKCLRVKMHLEITDNLKNFNIFPSDFGTIDLINLFLLGDMHNKRWFMMAKNSIKMKRYGFAFYILFVTAPFSSLKRFIRKNIPNNFKIKILAKLIDWKIVYK
jgi:hypothetical protein